jgi:ABC-type multidrug transport system permease subunit
MLGGSFFPFEAMPTGMALVGRLTPNGWALSLFKRILDGSVTFGTLAVSAVAAAVAMIALFYLVRHRLAAFARA